MSCLCKRLKQILTAEITWHWTGISTLVKSCLEDTRNEVEEFHSNCFEQATKLSSALDIPVTKPRTCKRQTKRDNMPAETIKDYFRMSITIPFLDHLISQMDTRLSNLHERALIGLKLVPYMLTQTTAAFDFSFLMLICHQAVLWMLKFSSGPKCGLRRVWQRSQHQFRMNLANVTHCFSLTLILYLG